MDELAVNDFAAAAPINLEHPRSNLRHPLPSNPIPKPPPTKPTLPPQPHPPQRPPRLPHRLCCRHHPPLLNPHLHHLRQAHPNPQRPHRLLPQHLPQTLHLTLSTQIQPTQVLGSSTNGKYYKVTLNDELVVAVKVMDSICAAASPTLGSKSMTRRAQRELELLARVKHQNVMILRAYSATTTTTIAIYCWSTTTSQVEA